MKYPVSEVATVFAFVAGGIASLLFLISLTMDPYVSIACGWILAGAWVSLLISRLIAAYWQHAFLDIEKELEKETQYSLKAFETMMKEQERFLL